MCLLNQRGYTRQQSLSLPIWEFWVLIKGAQMSDVRIQSEMYESFGLASGGYDAANSKKIHNRWKEVLSSRFLETESEDTLADHSNRKAAWLSMRSWFS